ncbi:ABC transporter permease [Demequina phytophila]|uniref:ABC transporter permease n=1 Tax=Demequina phytophila TaxID=1638981 RepID=UPI000782292C|nr:ABC transporter permease [Demequina phytophila]
MSAATQTDRAVGTDVVTHRAGYARAVRSEWIKARSVRSTWILVLVALAAFVLIPLLSASGGTVTVPEGTTGSALGMGTLYSGSIFVLILVAVLAALFTTSEFTTGMARNTFTATPARGAVLAAKSTIAALFALGIALVGAVAAWLATQGTLADAGMSIDLADPTTLKVLGVELLTYVVIAVLSVALGVLMRSSVGTIFTIVAMQLIAPGILLAVNNSIANWVGRVLPSVAGEAATAAQGPGPGEIGLSPAGGLLVLLAWAVLPYLAALWVLRSRDV